MSAGDGHSGVLALRVSWLVLGMAPLVMWLGFSQASADCIDYSDYLHWLGGVDLADQTHDVAVFGPYAYIAAYEFGLQVVDISDPQNPRIVGSVDTPGTALNVSVADNLVLIADFEHGLAVIDVADPQNRLLLGHVDTPGLAYGFRDDAYFFLKIRTAFPGKP